MSIENHENEINPTTLRSELKSWENAFKEKHGRKPGRADIKNDATIAAKYKLYDRVTRRETTAPKQTPRKSTRPKPKEDVDREKTSATPRKSASKNDVHPVPPLQPSPFGEVEETPAHIRLALGPTPLKNGQVLGLFDFTSATPSRSKDAQRPGVEALVAGTPSKGATTLPDPSFSKTPQSVGKRFFLDALAGTPLKRKRDDGDVGTTSSKKRGGHWGSAYLKRSFHLAPIDEEGAEPPTTRKPRKPGMMRTFSAMIQNLRDQQDEQMDEEWDIMREMEEEGESGGVVEKKKEAPKVMVQDSQAAEMPLGPDQAPVSDEESVAERDTGRKPWKKKGLKRQTRRSNMKPVLHKAKKADEVDEFDVREEDVVPETQLAEDPKHGSDDEYGSEPDFDEDEKSKRTKEKKSTAKEKDKDKEGKKAKPRKVNPDAHANFRKLNIKNKNSKAKGRGGRFGRR
ncbi:hypothetical protein PRZ48_011128 [Zasmidium cellare]|uniref:DNA replication regulator SLD2 n=1 Tax=Zasmidium cellare TaxID=395010 RepID=A0ABR0EAJ4_ZASCE|nr:hypothetical protein PRZ48_011128 [Zasmidium cellare]